MMTLELDDATAAMAEYLEDCHDAGQADKAYQNYLDGGKISHSLTLDDVVKGKVRL